MALMRACANAPAVPHSLLQAYDGVAYIKSQSRRRSRGDCTFHQASMPPAV